jgi:hypothetical protein
LWRGDDLDEKTRNRVIALYRLKINDAERSGTAPGAGDPVYLILAMTGARMLRMKPQNLLVGLPIPRPAVVA